MKLIGQEQVMMEIGAKLFEVAFALTIMNDTGMSIIHDQS